uniref:Fungal lipase-type domain-containing protein n=1 Tax=Erythrolobus madagascarensis TaxID=708628 RepID=A0A6T9Z0T6_9RHOD
MFSKDSIFSSAALDRAESARDSDDDHHIRSSPSLRSRSSSSSSSSSIDADLAELHARRGLSVLVHTYGSPRVGTAMFAKLYAQRVPLHWRHVMSGDIVPRVPKAFAHNWTHVGTKVLLKDNSDLIVDPTLVEEYFESSASLIRHRCFFYAASITLLYAGLFNVVPRNMLAIAVPSDVWLEVLQKSYDKLQCEPKLLTELKNLHPESAV